MTILTDGGASAAAGTGRGFVLADRSPPAYRRTTSTGETIVAYPRPGFVTAEGAEIGAALEEIAATWVDDRPEATALRAVDDAAASVGLDAVESFIVAPAVDRDDGTAPVGTVVAAVGSGDVVARATVTADGSVSELRLVGPAPPLGDAGDRAETHVGEPPSARSGDEPFGAATLDLAARFDSDDPPPIVPETAWYTTSDDGSTLSLIVGPDPDVAFDRMPDGSGPHAPAWLPFPDEVLPLEAQLRNAPATLDPLDPDSGVALPR